jgi:hypothetical protein
MSLSARGARVAHPQAMCTVLIGRQEARVYAGQGSEYRASVSALGSIGPEAVKANERAAAALKRQLGDVSARRKLRCSFGMGAHVRLWVDRHASIVGRQRLELTSPRVPLEHGDRSTRGIETMLLCPRAGRGFRRSLAQAHAFIGVIRALVLVRAAPATSEPGQPGLGGLRHPDGLHLKSQVRVALADQKRLCGAHARVPWRRRRLREVALGVCDVEGTSEVVALAE